MRRSFIQPLFWIAFTVVVFVVVVGLFGDGWQALNDSSYLTILAVFILVSLATELWRHRPRRDPIEEDSSRVF